MRNHKTSSTPDGYRKIEAGHIIRIRYYEILSGDSFCDVRVEFIPDANKNYTIVGGSAFKEGFIPILMTRRGCKLGIIDDETKKTVHKEYCEGKAASVSREVFKHDPLFYLLDKALKKTD